MDVIEDLPEQDKEFPTEGGDDEDTEQLTPEEKIQKEKERLDEIEADLKKNGGRR